MMSRLRRKAVMAVFLFTVFVWSSMMGLRTLNHLLQGRSSMQGGRSSMQGGRSSMQGGRSSMQGGRSSMQGGRSSDGGRELGGGAVVFTKSDEQRDHSIFYDVHIFYYLWYGSPAVDGRYIHWDHALVPHWDPRVAQGQAQGARHAPPDDIASSFYPELGPYSSRDPAVLENHMAQIQAAAAGVLVLSWYPPGVADSHGESTEDLVPAVMDAAHRHSIKVTFHLQPYSGRTELTVHDNVKYIIDKYGGHGAFYRFRSASTGRVLPLFYVYDSYLSPPEAWARLLRRGGSAHSVRGTAYDAHFLGLLVEERHRDQLLEAGFDGMYTYFASNGFSFGSSHQNWRPLKAFCDAHGLLFVPGAGPGYADAAVRSWNQHSARGRVSGRYYQTSLRAALSVRPDIVAVTSFNQWHEGTQIERAVPKRTANRLYLDYLPGQSDLYLELTRRWAELFSKEKDKWLM